MDKHLGGDGFLHGHGMDEVTPEVDQDCKDLDQPSEDDDVLQESSLNLIHLAVDIGDGESLSLHCDESVHSQPAHTLGVSLLPGEYQPCHQDQHHQGVENLSQETGLVPPLAILLIQVFPKQINII